MNKPGETPDERSVLRESFVDLYETEFVAMVRLAIALTGSEAAAEDLVHDAFIRVHKHWKHVEHPRAYLRAAVVNACRSAGRRAARERDANRAADIVDIVSLGADEVFDTLATLPFGSVPRSCSSSTRG